MKILLAPNDEKISISLKGMFEPDNLQILTAASIRHSIKLIESDPGIDLIITNTQIQEDSGIGLLTYLKQSQRYFWIPVIITSLHWKTSQVTECVDLGVNEMLAIPFTQEVFSAKVQNALNNGKRKVLIVEDDSLLLDLLKNIFELERFNTIGVNSYEKAQEILASEKIHLVISDILLPDGNGFDLLKLIKKEYSNLPVLLITGHSGKFKREHAFKEGADGFFKKPFNNKVLVQKARSLLAAPVKVSY